jgi:hypothetical protein
MTFTVPAGEVSSGVVWDYLRLELDENGTAPAVVPAAPVVPIPARTGE